MNFNSFGYIAFLIINIAVYFILPQKARNVWLLISSYYFYMCWNPTYALLMLFSTGVTFACGELVYRQALGKRKLWLASSLIVNLAILFFFKYYNFSITLVNTAFKNLGLAIDIPFLDVLLPVGISFYTFQALGYTIDVYRKDIEAEHNFVDYALFISFFPQLVAGPIERSKNMLHQLKEKHTFSFENIRDGALEILWGLVKKVVIADNAAVIANTVFNNLDKYNSLGVIIATLAFAFQIYCDFSAYSNIARGSALCLGFRLMKNFDNPYLSKSIPEFWRRWHISLSSWFKDYLYFPLGGSRCSKARHLINLMVVFLVSGLWHGAALTFVIWGALNGVYQVISILTYKFRAKTIEILRLDTNVITHKALQFVRVLFTFFLTCIAWIFFRANTLADAFKAFSIIGTTPITSAINLSKLGAPIPYFIMLAVLISGMMIVEQLNRDGSLAIKVSKSQYGKYAVYFSLVCLILVFGSYGTGYDPQDFVYFQF